jgi:hypothetical protein
MNTRRERPRPTGATWSEPRDAPPAVERRFHDFADLRRGIVETRPVARTLGAATRAKRLARLGFRADASVFGAPTYRLTAQTPYQASPEAWLDIFDAFSYSTGPEGSGQIWWRLPRVFETEFMSGVNCNFATPPTGALVLSLAIEAWPYQGATGVVVVEIGSLRVEVPISTAGARIIDIGFVQQNPDVFDARIFWRPGLIDFVFKSATVGAGLIVLDPIDTDLPLNEG